MSKNVFITGATAGIGEASAKLFAKNGFNLVITGRRLERLNKLAEQLIQENGVKVHVAHFDVRNKEEIKKAIENLPSFLNNRIDILVNNAGLAKGVEAFQNEKEFDKWEQMIDTNLKGLIYVTANVLPLIPRDGTGRIINISSIAGLESYAGGFGYNASKFGVEGFSNGIRIDLLKEKISVTNINPGRVETEFSIVRYEGDKAKADAVYNKIEPLVANDIAESIYWCACRPNHVNINQLVIMPRCQASVTNVYIEEK